MSHPATLPLGAGGPTAPDTLTLLHRRLLLAEEEADGLIRDMETLGVSRDDILGSRGAQSPPEVQRVLGDESRLWRQCDSLVSRVCRMESLLQTFKLTIFRLETERELDPPHTAHLTQQSEEQQRACRAEVVKLRGQLQGAHQERDEARAEAHRLWETVEASAAAKVDIAFAAEELKIVKREMSQKITEMKEQMRQESDARISHSRLLLRAEETETEVEVKRRQAELLRSDCRVLCAEVKTSRRQLEEERERGRRLEELCGQLEEQTAIQDSLMSQLKTELEAERSQVVKHVQEQDLLLRAARRNAQTELQVALTHSVSLQEELEKLKGEHARLLQSSSTAQEVAALQKELLERTVARLWEELSTAREEKEAMGEDLERSKNQRDAGSLISALERQRGENRRLMGKVAALEQQRHTVQHRDQMLRDMTEQKKPAYEKQKVKLESLQKALDSVTADKERLAQRLQQHQAAVTLRDEELHKALTKTTHLSEELGAVKRRFSEDYEFAMKKLHREISELKMTVEDSSTRSGDLSKGLHRRVSDLERLASTQRVRIRERRSQWRQQRRELDQDNTQKVEVSGKREAEWERWTATIQRWEAKRQLAHVTAGLNPVRTQLETRSHQ